MAASSIAASADPAPLPDRLVRYSSIAASVDHAPLPDRLVRCSSIAASADPAPLIQVSEVQKCNPSAPFGLI